uniref:Hemicentin-1-like n=1 Tax=Crassostrea virginica TaxID=6565 RepID=A0A8B8CY50_CRAVI|nr:hemicentin-1-like [Crassostrea virginica]
MSVGCQTVYENSDSVVISVKVPVTKVTLTPTPITVVDGQQMNLTCTTSYSNPAANITWIKSSEDITDLSTHTTDNSGGLVRTVSSLLITVVKEDNGKQVFCRASNTQDKSVSSTVHILNIMYTPEVSSNLSSPYTVREGETVTLVCTVTDANPNTGIIWKWIKTNNPNNVLHNGPNYTVSNIQKGSSGSYSCTANNVVGASEVATVYVDVLYKPSIEEKAVMITNETERVVLTRQISSNPLSNVSWFDGSQLLVSETTVNTTSFIIEKARCTDTKNFTLVVSNTPEWTVTSLVELKVNCKPAADENRIALWVSNITGIEFSTTVIAYPQPQFTLVYENGTKNNQMKDNLTWNAVNNFTIHYYQAVVKQSDYGTYHLRVYNSFGSTTIYVNVFRQEKPRSPTNVEVICEMTGAKVQWTSSFNGGNSQSFTVIAVDAQERTLLSKRISDNGETKLHSTNMQNLQPSMTYVFYVSARNSRGESCSEFRICTTSDKTNDQTAVVAGGVGGTLALVILILIIVFLVHRRYSFVCTINFEKRNRDNMDKTNQEASHYTAMAEQEQSDRNTYDELTNSGNVNQYEAVLMKEQEENTRMYEKLQHTNDNKKEDHEVAKTSC